MRSSEHDGSGQAQPRRNHHSLTAIAGLGQCALAGVRAAEHALRYGERGSRDSACSAVPYALTPAAGGRRLLDTSARRFDLPQVEFSRYGGMGYRAKDLRETIVDVVALGLVSWFGARLR
jgi:hypothetical protein